MADNFCMVCDTYLINDWKCACGLSAQDASAKNKWTREHDRSYPVKNPYYARRALTNREKESLRYRQRLSNINWMPW